MPGIIKPTEPVQPEIISKTPPLENKSEADFEEIEREVGRWLIVVCRDRRNVYHTQSQKLRDAYKAQIKLNADSYRTIAPVVFATASAVLQGTAVLMIASPKALPQARSWIHDLMNKTPGCMPVGRICIGDTCVDVSKMSAYEISAFSEKTAKSIDAVDKILQAIRGVKDLRDQGVRVETGAEMQLMQSISENRNQEHQKYGQEEADALRSFEQRRNKREDFELGMAR